jgi:rhodanese-related sulfurtransferase
MTMQMLSPLSRRSLYRLLLAGSVVVSLVAGTLNAREPGAAKVPPSGTTGSAAMVGAHPAVLDGTLQDQDPVPEISTAELQRVLNDRSAVVLDARPFAEYAVSHIPGAISVPGKPGLPPAQYTGDAAELTRQYPDRNQRLVLYCNGMYCGRSKRFGAELQKAGYLNLQRYQLGIPAWRALGGVTQVEKEALVSLVKADQTAVLVDGRDTQDQEPRLRGSHWIPLREASKAKDDGRLPMTDHNTRIFVVADGGAAARAVAEAIVRDAFHNVAFFDGTAAHLRELIAGN